MIAAWKTVGKLVFLFVVGFIIIFANFAIFGFPFPTETGPELLWAGLVLLAALLGIPLFR
ncbi:MAG: hypothetical protein GX335_04995 [Firmicutes bacterium]|nr:hypothetical protein [Bacillota bacterium]